MQPMQQDLLANGNYAQYLAHALTPPVPGTAGMMAGYGGHQGIGPQIGGNPGFSQFGQGQFGQGLPGQATGGMIPGGLAVQPGYGYPGLGYGYQGQQPGVGQPFVAQQHLAAQQQQVAATLHQLAHQAASQAVLGQQVGATLQQLAQYVASQGITGQQIAALLNQLAQQCAWQAQTAAQNRYGGWGPQFGSQAIYGQPFGYGQANGSPFAQVGGFNRLLW